MMSYIGLPRRADDFIVSQPEGVRFAVAHNTRWRALRGRSHFPNDESRSGV